MSRAGRERPQPARVPLRLLGNLGRFAFDALSWPVARRVSREWIALRLDQGVTEGPGGLATLPSRRAARPLRELLQSLERASRDRGVRGVLVRVGAAPLGFAQVFAIARAFGTLRAAGKRVVVYATSGGNTAAWLGARAESFWMPPLARLDLVGLQIQSPFLRGALDALGIRPEVIAAGRYKSAGEVLERESLSPPARESIEALAESLFGHLLQALAERAGDEATAREWIDGGPYLAEEAREIGLVDALVYPDEIEGLLARPAAEARARGPLGRRVDDEPEASIPELRLLAEPAYARLSRPRFRWQPLLRGTPRIAWVPVLGGIGQTSARRLARLLSRLEKRSDVRCVVLRVDSPGGDAGASDLAWRAVAQLAREKPVVASFGDTAASGGYYVAMAANEIVAEPTTLTGSIGVVLAGLGFADLMERLHLRMDGATRGRRADIYSPLRRRTSDERALLRRHVDALYRAFVAKAAEGRSLEPREVEAVAQGRVWTGAQALEHRLVDALGGGELAVARARSLAGLRPDEGRVAWFDVEPPRWTRWLRAEAAAGSPAWMRGLDAEPALRSSLGGAELFCPIRVRLD